MKRLAFLVLAFLLPELAWAACTPEQMIMIEFRNATPSVEEGSFATKPKTLYRYGDRYGRLEEAPNPKSGIHALVIVNKADVWQINRLDGRIRHIEDPDPESKFIAPVFGNPSMPDFLNEYEFGCELEFMKGRGVKPKTFQAVDRELELYSYGEDPYVIFLAVDPDHQLPVTSTLYENDELVAFIKYLSYAIYPEPEMALFELPGSAGSNEGD